MNKHKKYITTQNSPLKIEELNKLIELKEPKINSHVSGVIKHNPSNKQKSHKSLLKNKKITLSNIKKMINPSKSGRHV